MRQFSLRGIEIVEAKGAVRAAVADGYSPDLDNPCESVALGATRPVGVHRCSHIPLSKAPFLGRYETFLC